MKKSILIIIFFCLSLISFSQDTIVSPSGDKYSYYLTGDNWSQFKTPKTELSLSLFVSSDGDKSVWLQNISMEERQFKKLMNYIDAIPKIAVGAKAYHKSILDSFEIYSNDNNNADYLPMNKENNKNINIIYIQSKIKSFFKNK
jgi:hypothetical protein